MGQAKKRGSFEQRKAQAIARRRASLTIPVKERTVENRGLPHSKVLSVGSHKARLIMAATAIASLGTPPLVINNPERSK